MLVRYTIQRLIESIPTLLVISMIVFGLVLILPGDRVLIYLGYSGSDIGTISPEVYATMRERLGVDDPIPQQYVEWLWRAIQGDLGKSSRTGVPVMEVLLQRLPATLYLAGVSIFMGLIIAIPLGVAAAVRANSWVDQLANSLVLFGLVTPGFWVALLLILLFSVNLGWLPTFGYTQPTEDFPRFLKHIALPAVVLGIDFAANILRFLRTDFLEQLRQDYVRAVRAKGLTERVVLWKHVFKNSLIATVTVIGFDVSRLAGGSTTIETVFQYPGIAYLLLQAIRGRDFAVVQGAVLFIAVMVVLANYVADVLYAILNPRIRYGSPT